jgi:hypothetical protein
VETSFGSLLQQTYTLCDHCRLKHVGLSSTSLYSWNATIKETYEVTYQIRSFTSELLLISLSPKQDYLNIASWFITCSNNATQKSWLKFLYQKQASQHFKTNANVNARLSYKLSSNSSAFSCHNFADQKWIWDDRQNILSWNESDQYRIDSNGISLTNGFAVPLLENRQSKS